MGQREFVACLLACLLAWVNVIVVIRTILFLSLIPFFIPFIIFFFQFDERKFSYFLRIEEILNIFDNNNFIITRTLKCRFSYIIFITVI